MSVILGLYIDIPKSIFLFEGRSCVGCILEHGLDHPNMYNECRKMCAFFCVVLKKLAQTGTFLIEIVTR